MHAWFYCILHVLTFQSVILSFNSAEADEAVKLAIEFLEDDKVDMRDAQACIEKSSSLQTIHRLPTLVEAPT